MAFNILGGIDFVQQQGEQGRQRYADRLLGQAYAAPPEQRQSALAKLAGTDGRLAMDAGAAFQAQDDNAADRRNKLLTSRAGVMVAMPAEQRALMWPSVRADLVRNDPELAALPEQYDDAQFGPVIEKLAGGGGNSEMFSQKVGADGFIYNTDRQGRISNTGVKADRQMWFANNEGVDPYLTDKDGNVRMVGPGQQQPSSQQPSQIAVPNGDPKADAITQAANAMVAAGIPTQEIEAWMQRTMQTAGMQPTAGGQMPPQAAPADAGSMIPASGGGGGPAPSAAPVAPPVRQPTMADIPINDLGGGAINPLRRPTKAPTEAEESFGQPQAVTAPDGTVKMVQFGNRGGQREVPQYAPAPTDRDAKPPNDGERGAAGYMGRMAEAERLMEGVVAGGYEPGGVRDYYTAGQGPLLNWAASEQGQLYRQAQEDWVRSKLRKESGAVIGDDEMAREIKVYFPQPGDTPAVIAQKKASRAEAMQQMRTMAGRAAPKADAPSAAAQPGRIRYDGQGNRI